MRQFGNRNLLRRQLREAWHQTMTGPYLDQAINSERALQVHVAARLMNAFKEEGLNRQLFIEPMINVDGGTARIHPDIMICNSREVIGIMEIKFEPRISPSWQADIEKLESIGRQTAQIKVENPRYRGPGQEGAYYAIAKKPLFVWAGVYEAPKQVIPDQTPSETIARNLLVLHAVTHPDRAADVYAGTKQL